MEGTDAGNRAALDAPATEAPISPPSSSSSPQPSYRQGRGRRAGGGGGEESGDGMVSRAAVAAQLADIARENEYLSNRVIDCEGVIERVREELGDLCREAHALREGEYIAVGRLECMGGGGIEAGKRLGQGGGMESHLQSALEFLIDRLQVLLSHCAEPLPPKTSIAPTPASSAFNREKQIPEADTSVMIEGDGRYPTAASNSATLHGKFNVTALHVLRGADHDLVLTAGVDKKICISRWAKGIDSITTPDVLAEQELASPALALSAASNQLTYPSVNWIAAGCMDGSLAIFRLTAESPNGVRLEKLGVRTLHDKYVAHCSWNQSGEYLATGSHDRSVCVFQCIRVPSTASSPELLKLRLLQRLHFRGNVNALSWRESTLVAAVQAMPILYYITVNDLSSHAAGLDTLSASALPILTQTASDPSWAPSITPLNLLVHRVPISEDGIRCNISGPATSAYEVPATATLPSTSAISEQVGGDVTENGFFVPVGFTTMDIATSCHQDPCPLLAVAADNGIVYVFEWGTNRIIQRCAGHNVDKTLHTSTRLTWHPDHSFYLAASSDRDFAICVFSVASGKVVAKLGRGQSIARQGGDFFLQGDLASNASRYGHNLTSTAEGADLSSVQSNGHTGSIKAICWSAGDTLYSCGFDKRVICWH